MLIPLRIKSCFACVSAVALARSIHTDLGKWIGQSCKINYELQLLITNQCLQGGQAPFTTKHGTTY